MTYFDKYKKRLQAYGANESDASINANVDLINTVFTKNPSYKSATINGINEDIHFLIGDNSLKGEVVFRPLKTYGVGTEIVIDSNTWLALDAFPHKLYPKVDVGLCNGSLKWDLSGTIVSQPCHVQTYQYTLEYNQGISLPVGEIVIFVQSNMNTQQIKHSQRFVLGKQVYEVTGIDDLYRPGILRMSAKLDLTMDTDDFNNNIADNTSQRGGWDSL